MQAKPLAGIARLAQTGGPETPHVAAEDSREEALPDLLDSLSFGRSRRHIPPDRSHPGGELIEITITKRRREGIPGVPHPDDADTGYVGFALPADLEVEVVVVPQHPLSRTPHHRDLLSRSRGAFNRSRQIESKLQQCRSVSP